MARRGNHEGSIYRRSDGYWTAAISIGTKRKVVYGKTRREVAEKLARLQQAASTGALVQTERITVEQFMIDWLETVKPNLKPSTHASYEDLTRLHILPILGGMRLQSLRPLH